jgi:hypothetical protein
MANESAGESPNGDPIPGYIVAAEVSFVRLLNVFLALFHRARRHTSFTLDFDARARSVGGWAGLYDRGYNSFEVDDAMLEARSAG